MYDEEGGEVLSEEEFQSLKQLKQLKNDYRLKFDEHKSLKNEIFYCQKLVDQCRQKLIQGEMPFLSKSNNSDGQIRKVGKENPIIVFSFFPCFN